MGYLEPRPTACAVCGQTFDASLRNHGRGKHRYCSPQCRQAADNARHYRRNNPAKTMAALQRVCVICGIGFTAGIHSPKALTCSVKCNEARQNSARRRKTAAKPQPDKRECETCGAIFLPHPIALHHAKFCSHKCAVRAAQRRRTLRNGTRPSDARLNSRAWKEASAAAILRDGGKCQLCGVSDARLGVHHLFHRTDAERNDHSLGNLITLCGKCHNYFHDFKIGRIGGEVVISSAFFAQTGIKSVRIVPMLNTDDKGFPDG